MEIYSNLKVFLIKHKELISNLDYIVITGDLYDKLLYNGTEDMMLVIKFFYQLLKLAKENDIKLLLLEGTPSHDNRQMKTLVQIKEKSIYKDVYLKYFDKITFYHDKDNGYIFLFIPDIADAVQNRGELIYERVISKMKELSIEKVDMIFSHGFYDFQVPIKTPVTLNSNDFLDITKGYIVNGHDHIHKVKKRIIVPGSFCRLAHNEEEDKGAIYIEYGGDVENIWCFLKNDKAKIFKTIDIRGLSIIDSISRVKKSLKGIPTSSNIALKINGNEENNEILPLCKDNFKGYNFKLNKQNVTNNPLVIIDIERELEEITRDNITELLLKEMANPNLEYVRQELSLVI